LILRTTTGIPFTNPKQVSAFFFLTATLKLHAPSDPESRAARK
jgi:hypothetical protein